MKRFIYKTEVTVGLIVGAILTLAISGSIDLFLPLKSGGWSEAVRKSIHAFLGPPWENLLPVQIAFGAIAIFIITGLGALIGALFALMLSGFFRKMFHLLEKHEDE
ncbi:MAG: hypothetical protein COT35_01110 [Nitrospirae bacterium CG08_land_8_20_14_0_20_52_24]|nr:MAG: hypothetical protein AUK29_00345 [Nitrospirae bacterium CG2_30_53_67]PIS38386.1 MAG: hypothetical protein COT35_01110 [Nitrospirae bacterium CG08_land_8_20_14_0_20_52_24]PIV85760.1 MAG: hypothetical protein COW52_00490 [Nitrospirae bacterium CG17_big_fil_post_rev_8_21_14_2_50_50_9]PIX85794.1 MAG: hypothetical protein COZ32_06675 [Nitrospirae bacterium CG_4_10_14_3_um_filter_53_41]